MVRIRLRCPLCGNLAYPHQIDGTYDIDLFTQHGLGKGRGFSFSPINDIAITAPLLAGIKEKIYMLYHRFFGHAYYPTTYEVMFGALNASKVVSQGSQVGQLAFEVR